MGILGRFSGGGLEGSGFDRAPQPERFEEEEKDPVPYPIEVTDEEVMVLETAIPKGEGGPLVPIPQKFEKSFTLDERTLDVIEKIAEAVVQRDPCLLEGATATSKTSSIEYLAMRANQEVVRLNLNGQTDTSELIGKYVPNDRQAAITFEKLIAHKHLLSERSLGILEQCNKDGRAMSLEECQAIARIEGVQVPEWKWQDGIIPDAMRKGRWVILDEINLAEPQVLERLNPVLERHPSLVLSERDGAVIGNGDDPVHNNFRIFATMNPAEYVGREPMSPAYVDRWTARKLVPTPKQKEYTDMLRLITFGIQPELNIRGIQYKAERVEEPLHGDLKKVPNFMGFLTKLAKFQEDIEQASDSREIGKNRKEAYIFTRRGLIEFLEYLETKEILDRTTGETKTILEDPKEIVLRALKYYFLDKISDPDDLAKARDLLKAVGLDKDHFTHKFEYGAGDKDTLLTSEKKAESFLRGREAEEFLRYASDYLESNGLRADAFSPTPHWHKGTLEDGSAAIDMRFIQAVDLPEELVEEVDERMIIAYEECRKGHSLEKELEGKRIVSTRGSKGRWILRILNDGSRK